MFVNNIFFHSKLFIGIYYLYIFIFFSLHRELGVVLFSQSLDLHAIAILYMYKRQVYKYILYDLQYFMNMFKNNNVVELNNDK